MTLKITSLRVDDTQEQTINFSWVQSARLKYENDEAGRIKFFEINENLGWNICLARKNRVLLLEYEGTDATKCLVSQLIYSTRSRNFLGITQSFCPLTIRDLLLKAQFEIPEGGTVRKFGKLSLPRSEIPGNDVLFRSKTFLKQCC